MKTLLQIFTFCCVIFLIYTPGYTKAELEIVDSKFDFGITPNNSIISKSFWFKSIGEDTLKISNTKTGCTCAIMPLEQDYIAPGDSMQVKFIWDVGRKIFKIGRYPYIFTNAKDDAYRMELTAEIHQSLDSLQPISISPYKGEFSKLKEKSIDEMEFVFTNHSDKDINISIVYIDTTECSIQLPKMVAANSTQVGKIKVKNNFLDKEFNGSVTFLLDNFQKTKITIPYRRKIY